MNLCILIPAKNEEGSIHDTISNINNKLNNVIPINILVVNDHSEDQTEVVLKELIEFIPNLTYINNEFENGVGNAIRYGLKFWSGDIVVICMADGSDSPDDILLSYETLLKGKFDCVFGTRFTKGSIIINYPFLKLILNRLFNNFVKILTKNNFNDYTNIFKMYRRNAIEKISPLQSTGFSIGLEMCLKSFSRKKQIGVIPISWRQRTSGKSKLNLIKNIRVYFTTLLSCIKYEKR